MRQWARHETAKVTDAPSAFLSLLPNIRAKNMFTDCRTPSNYQQQSTSADMMFQLRRMFENSNSYSATEISTNSEPVYQHVPRGNCANRVDMRQTA